MKRKDLEVGKDYLLDTSVDWQRWEPSTRVRVASLDPLYMENPSRYRWEDEQEHDITLSDGRTIRVHKTIQPAIPGTSTEREAARVVLVEMGHKKDEDDPNPSYHLVRLTQIRAPWQEAVEAYKKVAADRQRREAAKAAEVHERRQRIARLQQDAGQILGRTVHIFAKGDTDVLMSLDDVTALVEATKSTPAPTNPQTKVSR